MMPVAKATPPAFTAASGRHQEEGIGLVEVLDRVSMQVFVREHCTMVAAPVQCDVDGIAKGSHNPRVGRWMSAGGPAQRSRPAISATATATAARSTAFIPIERWRAGKGSPVEAAIARLLLRLLVFWIFGNDVAGVCIRGHSEPTIC